MSTPITREWCPSCASITFTLTLTVGSRFVGEPQSIARRPRMNRRDPDTLLDIGNAIAELEHRVQELEAVLGADVPSRRALVIGESQIRRVVAARRLRDQYLGKELCSDPAMDLLLEALAADLAGNRLTVSQLCRATTVPLSTAVRWIKKLEEDGWLQIHHSCDEIQWVEMTPDGSTRLRSLFDALGPACFFA